MSWNNDDSGGWKDDTAANGDWHDGDNAGASTWDDGAIKSNAHNAKVTSWDDGAFKSDGDNAKASTWDDGALKGDTDMAGGNVTDGDAALAGDNRACRHCKSEDHQSRDCPDKPEGADNCFNCGEPGHTKAECPNPKVFNGKCRICEEEGHRSADCPSKPPPKCKNCQEEGHLAMECKNNRVFDTSGIDIKSAEDAWTALVKADEEKDLDDIKMAIKVYIKAVPDTTWDQLERGFRANKFNTHIIGQEVVEVTSTYTLINLQGKLDQKYKVGFYFSPHPRRHNSKATWPPTPEENVERLKDAGLPYERGIPKCSRCNELGHTTRTCPEERLENSDRVVVNCVNCEAVGHRARDCPEPRKDRFACRNCKQSGHTAAECTEPRSAEGVQCKKCEQMGHFAKDCPTGGGSSGCRNCGQEGHKAVDCTEPKNPANFTCRNCDEKGHFTKECPKPRDYSRIKCSNCEQMGHTKVRCPEPPKEEGADGGFGAGDAGFGGGDGGFGPETNGGGDWNAGGDTGNNDTSGWGAEQSTDTATAW